MGIQRTTVRLLGDRPKGRFTTVPNALILDTGLSSDARLVGIYLRSLSDGRETNQEQIAAELGWPTKSKRVGNAMRNLIERGWLRHTERKGPKRAGTYKHEYVMYRDRRFNTVESTVMDETTPVTSTVESTPVTTVKSTVLPKEQRDQMRPNTTTAPLRAATVADQDPWEGPGPAAPNRGPGADNGSTATEDWISIDDPASWVDRTAWLSS